VVRAGAGEAECDLTTGAASGWSRCCIGYQVLGMYREGLPLSDDPLPGHSLDRLLGAQSNSVMPATGLKTTFDQEIARGGRRRSAMRTSRHSRPSAALRDQDRINCGPPCYSSKRMEIGTSTAAATPSLFPLNFSRASPSLRGCEPVFSRFHRLAPDDDAA